MPSPSSSSLGGTPERVVAIVPVGSLEGAKSRLGAVLDAEERLDLTIRLARATIAAAVAAERVDEGLVITPGGFAGRAVGDRHRPVLDTAMTISSEAHRAIGSTDHLGGCC